MTPSGALLQVRLQAPQAALGALASFYRDRLGLPCDPRPDALAVRVGASTVVFDAAADPPAPYYHFAFRVPARRFAAAYAWLAERVAVLPDAATGDRITVFDGIGAVACYAHDPAGNIVELIAFDDLDVSDRPGEAFSGRELVEVAEIGMVTDDIATLAADLGAAGIEIWSGAAATGGLAFAGRRGASVILAECGRPWLPTRRPAESHSVGVTLAGAEFALTGARPPDGDRRCRRPGPRSP